jgi:hypothetical protein
MGTRNLTCIVKDGEFKVAQYGQWDGYPSGNGVILLNLLSQPTADFDLLKEQVDKCRPLTKDEEVIAEGENWKEAFPQLSRDIGADIVEMVLSNEEDEFAVYLDTDFAKDSLFCEWAYVIDLDKMTFEVYEGFNKTVLDEDERFYSKDTVKEEYQPVMLAASYDLNNLPTPEEFLATLEPEEDEE